MEPRRDFAPSEDAAGRSQAGGLWAMTVWLEGLKGHWAVFCKRRKPGRKRGISFRIRRGPLDRLLYATR